jgi:hypothetical protein
MFLDKREVENDTITTCSWTRGRWKMTCIPFVPIHELYNIRALRKDLDNVYV